MRAYYRAVFFFALLAIHLLSLAAGWPTIVFITKPMLMLAVTGYLVASVRVRSSGRTLILMALFFSWAGDVLLLFQRHDSLYFLLGLSSFLIAHLFYIFFFHQIKKGENIKSRLWTLLVVAVYYSVLIALLNPWLGEMRLPVRVYGLVISFMLLLALHMFYLGDKMAGKWMAAGAILFVISDSVLAINKFFRPVPGADVLIMLTYGLAQFCLVYGAARFLRMKSV